MSAQRETYVLARNPAGKVIFQSFSAESDLRTMKRLSLSILLTRDLDSTEAFLVQRNPGLSFFGGFLAFPGGTVDAEDADLPVRNLPRPRTIMANRKNCGNYWTSCWMKRGLFWEFC